MKRLNLHLAKQRWRLAVRLILAAGLALSVVAYAVYNLRTRSALAALTAGIGQYTQPCPEAALFTDPRDGNTYRTTRLGSQCWLAENLRYLPAVSPATIVWDDTPHYYAYDYQGQNLSEAKATANYQNYGVLYNWFAAQTACPAGWHLPTDTEWTALTDYLIGTYPHLTAANVGAALKACRQVNSPLGGNCATAEQPRWALDNSSDLAKVGVTTAIRRVAQGVLGEISVPYGSDQFGFSALPGGRVTDGGFYYQGELAYWWAATSASPLRAWARQITLGGTVNRWDMDKNYGYTIRCIWD